MGRVPGLSETLHRSMINFSFAGHGPECNDRDSARSQGDQEAKEKFKIETFEKSKRFGF